MYHTAMPIVHCTEVQLIFYIEYFVILIEVEMVRKLSLIQ